LLIRTDLVEGYKGKGPESLLVLLNFLDLGEHLLGRNP